MFDNLLESSATQDRNLNGHAFSVVLHTVLITCAVLMTHHVVTAAETEGPEAINYVAPADPIPPPVAPLPPNVSVTPPLPKGYQVLITPIDIPDVLPAIDLTKPVTNASDYTGHGAAGGTDNGATNGVARPLDINATYLGTEVDKVVAQIAGTGTPEYPEMLRSGGIEGEVQVSFAVDTTGRADMTTFKVTKATRTEFADAVRRALPKMRFFPAEAGGRKVRQLVVMPFVFSFK